MSDSWNCPFCNRAATVGRDNISYGEFYFDDGNKLGVLGVQFKTITCPNAACREYTLSAGVYGTRIGPNGSRMIGDPLLFQQLRPQSSARPFPAYIPAPILDDYSEACLIRDLSPKASATLSRRCLQGMIRDFWGVAKNRLIDEINALQDKIDPATWAAIDAVRSIGNIGAHMEKDINLVIDVDADEAQMLIELIEVLFGDWYIARHKRSEHLADIVALAEAKKTKLAKVPADH